MALTVLVAWLLLGGGVGTASAGFTEMLRRVGLAKTVSYDAILRVPGAPEIKVRMFMAYPGRTRVVWPEGKVSVFDYAERKCLTLLPEKNTAMLARLAPGSAWSDPLDELRRADVSTGRLVGTETLAGREADVYEVIQDHGIMRVFVDSERQLPARIEITSRSQDGREATTVLENFSWNEQFPDSLFSLAPPQSYVLVHPEGDPTEASLIELLRICAQMGGGSFPAQLDSLSVLELVLATYRSKDDAYQIHKDGIGPTVTELPDSAKDIYKACLRGLAFVKQVSENGSWRYAGEGVKLGDASAEVCRWKPIGSESHRAIYGGLRVTNVPTKPPVQQPVPRPAGDGPPEK